MQYKRIFFGNTLRRTGTKKREFFKNSLLLDDYGLFTEISLQQTGERLPVTGFVTEMLNFRRFFKHIIVLAQTKAQIAKTL